MADKEDLGEMAKYYINKDIEFLMVNRIKIKLEYIEKHVKELEEEITLLRSELHELGVDF